MDLGVGAEAPISNLFEEPANRGGFHENDYNLAFIGFSCSFWLRSAQVSTLGNKDGLHSEMRAKEFKRQSLHPI